MSASPDPFNDSFEERLEVFDIFDDSFEELLAAFEERNPQDALPAQVLEALEEPFDSPVQQVDSDDDFVPDSQPDHQPVLIDPQNQQGGNVGNRMVINEVRREHARALGTERRYFDVRFRDTETIPDVHTFLRQAIQHGLTEALQGTTRHDRVGLEVRHPGLDAQIPIPLRPRERLDADTILREIENVQQSDSNNFAIDDEMQWIITVVKVPAGSGRNLRVLYPDLDDWLLHKKHTKIEIKHDHNCLARALIVGKAHTDWKQRNLPNGEAEYQRVRKDEVTWHHEQKKQAVALLREAGLPEPTAAMSLDMLTRFYQTPTLHDYRLQVYSTDHLLARVVDIGQGPTIRLLYHNKHYEVITNVVGFFEKGYYCDACGVAYHNKFRHIRCGHNCPSCYNKGRCDQAGDPAFIKCTDCRLWFYNQACYNNHKKLKDTKKQIPGSKKRENIMASTCTQIRLCDCGAIIRDKRDHECGKFKCNICKELVEQPHFCHMQILDEPEPPAKTLIFYDIEASQEKVIGQNANGPKLLHQANLVIANRVNTKTRKQQEQRFRGVDCIQQFCRWLFAPANRGAVAIAHNSKGYDAQYVLDWIHEQAVEPDVLTRGTEILRLEYNGVSLLDSYCFMPMALSALPAQFGLEGAKGHFPHLYNRQENWGTTRQGLPPLSEYGADFMKPKARDALIKWHNEHKDDVFVFDVALEHYCAKDVEILTAACLKFRKLFLDDHKLDPFTNAVTIPGVCMKVFQLKYLQPETVGIIPNGGYRKAERQSAVAIKWIKWISEQNNLDLQHARNGQEVCIKANGVKYKLDAQDRRDRTQVYEFNGCIFHGCPKCIKNRDAQLPKSEETARTAFERTLQKKQDLEGDGYVLHTMWECDLKMQLQHNDAMKTYFANCNIEEPMDPREAFYGGRTNCRKMRHECEEGEDIRYIDVCSLYPWVCKYGCFPVGHPFIYTENFDDLSTRPYKGLIKCTVVPPKHLLHPILPYRSKGKLLFPLCRTCAEERNDGTCEHDDGQRSIKGAWATCELYKALDEGYMAVSVLEVYHFDDWLEYEEGIPDSGLYTEYINYFLKMKAEASGYPGHVNTDAEKQAFVAEYYERESIRLEPAGIVHNPGRRALAKLCLNSLWGKFGQRCTLSKRAYFTTPQDLYALVLDPSNEVSKVEIMHDSMVRVTYSQTDAYVKEAGFTNPIVAAWVTAQARLKLWSYLKPLGDRVLYMDTDSIIYLTKPKDTWQPEIADFLGCMTDELNGDTITEFVSCGPKQYAYKTAKGSCTVKIRGICLTHDTSKLLNFDSMKKMVQLYLGQCQDDDGDVVQVKYPQILRTAKNKVITQTSSKTMQIVYDKCRVLPSGVCVPFGFS